MIPRFLSGLTCATVIENIGIERFRGRKKLSMDLECRKKIFGSTHLGIIYKALGMNEIIQEIRSIRGRKHVYE